MSSYFTGISDLASLDLSHLEPDDELFILTSGPVTLNDAYHGNFRYLGGSGVNSLSVQSCYGPICCTTHPALTWPGAASGGFQVFLHADWPGMYRTVNVHPRFWHAPLIAVEEIVHRGECLPNCPVGLPETPIAQTEARCSLCHAPLDLRYSWGHGWHDGARLIRAGTDEIIAVQVGHCMLDAPGPYCAQCVEAALYGDGLQVPDGYRYLERHNRSLPVDCELPEHPSKWKWVDDHPYSEACRRYGENAFEWTLEEDPHARNMRIRNVAKLLREMKIRL